MIKYQTNSGSYWKALYTYFYKEKNKYFTNLIFINIIGQLCLAKLIECDDDKSDEYVDEEERKDNEVDDIVDRHFCSKPGIWALVFVRRGHGILQNPERNDCGISKSAIFIFYMNKTFHKVNNSKTIAVPLLGKKSTLGEKST